MPFDATRMSRLSTAVSRSRRMLEPFRKNREAAIRQFVGKNYSDNGSSASVPLNMIALAINIYLTQLVGNCPQVLASTQHPDLRPAADDLQLALNHLIRHEIDLENTLWQVALDGMFGMGILKVGMCKGYEVEIEGFLHDVGQPFADRVSIDDWVMDMSATHWDQMKFMGNRYRLPLEQLRSSGLFDEEWAAALKPRTGRGLNEQGDRRAEAISRGDEWNEDEDLYDEAELWDLWLPLENVVITVEATNDSGPMSLGQKAGRTVEWTGPEQGPFRVLWYEQVPDQLMPLPPVAQMTDLHELINVLYRKLSKQAKRQKKIGLFAGGADGDAKRMNDTNDGEWARNDTPGGTEERSMGGIDQGNYGFLVDALGRFSYIAGNLDALGGLSPQSDTLGQDQLLTESASKRLVFMQTQMVGFTGKVCEDLGSYLFNDPLIEIPITKAIGNGGLSLNTVYGPEEREGDFLQYNIEIEPYSMKYQSPGQKLQTVTNTLQLVLPIMPMLQEQGISLNIEGLLKLIAKYSNLRELDQLITFSAPQQQERGPVGEAPAKAAVSTRNYVRTNRSTATRQGQDAAKVQTAMGGNVQAAEAMKMFQQVG